MLYLPRLFAYHADAPKGSAMSEMFKIMERRLLKGIINPAMIAVLANRRSPRLYDRLLAVRLAAGENSRLSLRLADFTVTSPVASAFSQPTPISAPPVTFELSMKSRPS